MALLLFQGSEHGEDTMTTNTQTTVPDVDAPAFPEVIGDHDDKVDTRKLVPDVEAPDPDDAGYGYGV